MRAMGMGSPLPWKGVPPKAAGVVLVCEVNPRPFGPPPSKEGGFYFAYALHELIV